MPANISEADRWPFFLRGVQKIYDIGSEADAMSYKSFSQAWLSAGDAAWTEACVSCVLRCFTFRLPSASSRRL